MVMVSHNLRYQMSNSFCCPVSSSQSVYSQYSYFPSDLKPDTLEQYGTDVFEAPQSAFFFVVFSLLVLVF